MATVFIDEARLTAIGDAIRAKTGGTELIPVVEMPTEIAAIVTGGGGDLPEGCFKFSGILRNWCQENIWAWFFNAYKDQITTENISAIDSAFRYSTTITDLPFDFNFKANNWCSTNEMFAYCENLTNIGRIINLDFYNTKGMFQDCKRLRESPEFVNPTFETLHNGTQNISSMFQNCYSLRNIPEDLQKNLWTKNTASYASFYNYRFYNCWALDEIRGLPVVTDVTYTSNMFNSYTFDSCGRLKEMLFDTDNGTPKKANWKNQVVELSMAVGYVVWSNIQKYNSGITEDKCLDSWDDAVKYNSLKNDPDWTSCCYEYSRYNHDSAVNTINSLPDCSSSGGTNTIKFRGEAGSKTDGGAINTLTEEEIAVATAKGWTVTLV